MVRKVIKRHFVIRQVGRKARQLNQAIESRSAMVQVDLLVPPKRLETGQRFVTQVAERSKLRPRTIIVQRFARRTAVTWVLQVNLVIALPFATQADAQLDQHPTAEVERPFGTTQDVRRDQPAATGDERLAAHQTISSRSRKIALIYLKEQKTLEPKVQRKYQSVPHAPLIQPLRLRS
jgi:hypothetical protein